MIYSNKSLSCPELNLIKDKTPVLGLDIVERRSSYIWNLQFRKTEKNWAFESHATF